MSKFTLCRPANDEAKNVLTTLTKITLNSTQNLPADPVSRLLYALIKYQWDHIRFFAEMQSGQDVFVVNAEIPYCELGTAEEKRTIVRLRVSACFLRPEEEVAA